MRNFIGIVVLPAVAAVAACSDGRDRETAAFPITTTSAAVAQPAESAVVLAVGDIAGCSGTDDEAVAALVGTLEGEVLLLGDIAYPNGTPQQFERCFEPAWERLRDRLQPAPGNHDYGTAGAAGYFGWFGAAAGEPGKGWYSFEAGPWHVVALNSNCSLVGGCRAGSEQERWLRADLAASEAECTLAFWHHARFSSGSQHGSDAVTRDLWQALADARADVVVTGHEHVYERFAPLDAVGRVDRGRGIRSFVVGTGGRSLYGFGRPRPGSEVRRADTFGVLELTLSAGDYRWRFVPVSGGTSIDAGQARCH